MAAKSRRLAGNSKLVAGRSRYIVANPYRRPSRTSDDVRQSLTKGNGTMKLGRFVPLSLGGVALIVDAPR
jgi:hypothetical protein